MRPHTPRHLRLAIALLQEPRRFHSLLLQCLKISANSRWIAHTGIVLQNPKKCQYIIQYSIVLRPKHGRAERTSGAHAACGMIAAMPNPGLCRIEYEACDLALSWRTKMNKTIRHSGEVLI